MDNLNGNSFSDWSLFRQGFCVFLYTEDALRDAQSSLPHTGGLHGCYEPLNGIQRAAVMFAVYSDHGGLESRSQSTLHCAVDA